MARHTQECNIASIVIARVAVFMMALNPRFPAWFTATHFAGLKPITVLREFSPAMLCRSGSFPTRVFLTHLAPSHLGHARVLPAG
jgi:hypothetical protein